MQLDRYRKRTENQVKDSTLQARMSALERFNSFIGGGEPSVEDVEDWIDSMIEEHNEGEIKATTIRQYFKAVRYYFETVKGEHDSLEHIKRWLPDIDVDHGEYLTEEEWDMLIENTYGFRDRAIIFLMYQYARRPSEVILLNKEDIDMEEMTITFNILKKKKDDRGRNLPMMELMKNPEEEPYDSFRVFRATFELTEKTKEFLKDWDKYRSRYTEYVRLEDEISEVHPLFTTTHGRISYDTVWNMIKSKTEDIGIDKNITPKSMRHSRTTHLDWAGNAPGEIARHQLIHDPDSDVVGSYIHNRDEEQVREVMSTDDEE